MKRLPLYKGGRVIAYALVDDADAKRFGLFTWRMSVNGYAWRTEYEGGRTKNIFLHRLIVGLAHGDRRFTDHINRKKLDCRRSNLRIVTKHQNGQNLSKSNYGRSRFRGVDLKCGRWRARVTLNGRQHDLGRFSTEREAGAVAAEFRREHMPFSEADAA